MTAKTIQRAIVHGAPSPLVLIRLLMIPLLLAPAHAQKTPWRQATAAELASVLPSRAQVVNEHIETEMRTASGIVNGRGQFIAGVVLLTAGYSADGKYSHYLVVQAPIRIANFTLEPGDYVLSWLRAGEEDVLNVHFNLAATGQLVGTAKARRIEGPGRVESIHIWPPQDGALIQIGRFSIHYQMAKERSKKTHPVHFLKARPVPVRNCEQTVANLRKAIYCGCEFAVEI